MSVGSLVHGVGLALISILGLITNILHFIKFSKSIKRDIFDKILLQCMVFNVVAVIFGFFLTSFTLLLEHHEVHSNFHTSLTQLNIFGTYVGLGGSSTSIIILLLERFLMSSYRKWHSRLNIIWISVMTTVSVSIVAVFHLLEYEVVCVAGYNGPTEDILGICPEGKMAYITYSNMRDLTGYRTFVIIEVLITSELFPLMTIPVFVWCIFRTNQWFNIKTICTFIASGMLFLVTLIQLLPVSYELHSLSMKHSKWEFHTAMPEWVFEWYQVSHFINMLMTTLLPLVFNVPHIYLFIQKSKNITKSTDGEMLVTVIRNEEMGEDDEVENQSTDEKNVASYSNPAYSMDLNHEYQVHA